MKRIKAKSVTIKRKTKELLFAIEKIVILFMKIKIKSVILSEIKKLLYKNKIY